MWKRRQFLRDTLAIAGGITLSTALSGCAPVSRREDLAALSFGHGVASGDPDADSVVLWTRAVPEDGADQGRLGWELAADPDFRQLVRSGEAQVQRRHDFTVKVDVRGLEPGREYYYRFLGAAGDSPTGRTKTLPDATAERVRLAVFSCSNYPAGYFYAYREAARLPAIDAFLHLGDYFYEYGMGGYATDRAGELGRALPPDNAGELLSLDDYRRRYALYRSDPDLQAMHAAAPMIAVWDDHEIANDAWMGGAQNHDAGEGDYAVRRAAAVQAYFEWLPLRPLMPDSAGRIYRGFEFGDLVSLHMLDTRLIGRDEPLEYGQYLMGADAAAERAAMKALQSALMAEDRALLGDAQQQWLATRLAESRAPWQVLGQQVIMARMHLPEKLLATLFRDRDPENAVPLLKALGEDLRGLAAGQQLDAAARARLANPLPYNLDAWDGYPAARERLYQSAQRAGKELLVLSGDTHNSWFSRLKDAGGSPVGWELATPGVSSPGMESYLNLDASLAGELAALLPALIEELRYCELQHRGFLEVEFGASACDASWHHLSSVTDRAYTVTVHRERITL